jgi:hypothetical protein
MPESPIGSIIAYGGEIKRGWEDQNGWLRCDGRLLDGTQPDYVALFEAIGFAWGGDGDSKFNVPDLQGFFLRGVDQDRPQDPDTRVPYPVDPDSSFRFANHVGGNAGNMVGTAQHDATLAPRKPLRFITDTVGHHRHGMNFETTASRDVDGQYNTVAYPSRVSDVHQWPQTETAGDHKHEIEFVGGGDRETRPVNAYVHWIIRYK